MKKNLLLTLLMGFMFSSLAIAEETQPSCDDKLTVCLEKCTGKNAEQCEDVCYENQDICLEKEDK